MPGPGEHDSVVGHSFILEVDGVRVATLTEVSGLTLESEVVEVKETAADGTFVIKRMPGRRRPGEVLLTRGLTDDGICEYWARGPTHGPVHAHGSVSIVVFDVQGRRVATYALAEAWPRRLEIGGLTAGADEVLTEQLVLVYQSLERT